MLDDKRKCRIDGCNKYSTSNKLCTEHGGKNRHKKCVIKGCKSNARDRNQICVKHGASNKLKKCKIEGCKNFAAKNQVCQFHGAGIKHKKCTAEGCTRNLVKCGKCCIHGAKPKRTMCTFKGCDKFARNNRLCTTHQEGYEPPTKISRGEKEIIRILDKHHICYIHDEQIDNLKGCGGKKLRFDFQILGNDTPLLIEFDGRQHFHPISRFGGEEAFKNQKINDEIKNKHCNDNNYHLLRIKYTHFNKIEELIIDLITTNSNLLN